MPGREQHASSSPPPPGSDGSSGVRGTIVSFTSGLRQYLQARAELLSIESREAALVAARMGILGGVLGLALASAYVLLLVTSISLLGHWLAPHLPGKWSQFGWQTAAAAVALLHLGLAAWCYRSLRKRIGQPLFEITRSEFLKDRQWLHDQQTDSEKSS